MAQHFLHSFRNDTLTLKWFSKPVCPFGTCHISCNLKYSKRFVSDDSRIMCCFCKIQLLCIIR